MFPDSSLFVFRGMKLYIAPDFEHRFDIVYSFVISSVLFPNIINLTRNKRRYRLCNLSIIKRFVCGAWLR